MPTSILIRGGRVIDPVSRRDARGDLYLVDGRIAERPAPLPAGTRTISAAGRVVVPALIDLHVHLREPGLEAAETIASGTRAAAAGGFGAVVAMPNTQPPIDTPERLREEIASAVAAGFCDVWPSACLTRGRSGAELAPLAALAAAGAAAFTDDGTTVMSDALMRRAMAEAARLGRTVMDHAQDHDAEQRGVMHEGTASRRLGLPGIPTAAETRIVERDIRLARETGCTLHIQHISSREGAERVRRARAEGLRVTAEVTPHHLALCDEDLAGPDANFKMNPPLRAAADREALLAAVLDGTLTCFATDHAPHTAEAKARGMLHAPFGIVGLETAVGVTYTLLVKSGRMTIERWLRAWTLHPAAVLGREPPSLAPGQPANVTILDLDSPWTVNPARFVSRSHNTPFSGRVLTGRSVCTIYGGNVVFEGE